MSRGAFWRTPTQPSRLREGAADSGKWLLLAPAESGAVCSELPQRLCLPFQHRARHAAVVAAARAYLRARTREPGVEPNPPALPLQHQGQRPAPGRSEDPVNPIN